MPSATSTRRLRQITLLLVAFAGAPLAFSTAQAASAVAKATPAAGKRPISHDVYDGWRSIQGTQLSRDGQWLVYALVAQDGDGQLVARNLKTGQEWRQARGKDPVLTADGRFVAFTVAATKAELDKAKKAKKKPEDMPKAGMGVLELATGKVETLERVKSFRLAEDGNRFLAALLEADPKDDAKPERKPNKKDDLAFDDPDQRRPAASGAAADKDPGKKEPGTELVLWELGTANRTRLAEVAELAWSKDGALLGYTVSVKEPKAKDGKKEDPKEADSAEAAEAKPANPDAVREGAFVMRLADGAVTPLLTGPGTYKGLVFDDQGQQAAFLSNHDEAGTPAPGFKAYHWSVGAAAASEIASAATAGMPAGAAPCEFGRLDFSKDGQRLFLGTAPKPKAASKDAPEPVKVDIWSWQDPELQPMQKVRAEDQRKQSFRAVVHVASKRFVQLGSETFPDLDINDNPEVALGFAPNAYRQLMSWDRGYADVYAIDLQSGERKLLAEKLPWSPRMTGEPGRGNHLSPAGKYLYYFSREAKAWMAVSTRGGAPLNLTATTGVNFAQEEFDLPDLPGAYGEAGWTAQDEALVVYDHYDLWALRPGSGARNLSAGAGRKGRLELRYLKLDPEDKVLPGDQPWLLAATQVDSRASGFYRLTPGTPGEPVQLLFKDKAVGGLVKAKRSDQVVFTEQRFDEFPDLHSTTTAFKDPRRISDANPQQKDFVWGKSELIEYINGDGKVLKAILTKPENFDPAKKYPMIVNIYEKLSDRLHTYLAPAPGTSINITRFASNGYIVLRPDIAYTTGHPGESASPPRLGET